MADDLEQEICDNAEGPRKGVNNMGSFEQHSLPDMIAADKHITNKGVGANGTSKFLGMLFRKSDMPGPM